MYPSDQDRLIGSQTDININKHLYTQAHKHTKTHAPIPMNKMNETHARIARFML